MKVKVIPTDYAEPMRVEELKGDKLQELQKLVDGYVEQVRLGRYPAVHKFNGQDQVVPPDGSLLMIVNEEGLIHQLPTNYRASILYGTQHHGQPICGQAVLIGEVETNEGLDWGDYPLED